MILGQQSMSGLTRGGLGGMDIVVPTVKMRDIGRYVRWVKGCAGPRREAVEIS